MPSEMSVSGCVLVVGAKKVLVLDRTVAVVGGTVVWVSLRLVFVSFSGSTSSSSGSELPSGTGIDLLKLNEARATSSLR